MRARSCSNNRAVIAYEGTNQRPLGRQCIQTKAEGTHHAPIGLPRGDTPLILAVTTVIELSRLTIVAYWVWLWKKNLDRRQRYLDEKDRIHDEQLCSLDKAVKPLPAYVDRTASI